MVADPCDSEGAKDEGDGGDIEDEYFDVGDASRNEPTRRGTLHPPDISHPPAGTTSEEHHQPENEDEYGRVWRQRRIIACHMGPLPPASAPEDLREQAWTLWQLHSFDDNKDHDPTFPSSTFPTTWASWYRGKYRQESNVTWNFESSACPDDIYRLYRSQLADDPEEDVWGELR